MSVEQAPVIKPEEQIWSEPIRPRRSLAKVLIAGGAIVGLSLLPRAIPAYDRNAAVTTNSSNTSEQDNPFENFGLPNNDNSTGITPPGEYKPFWEDDGTQPLSAPILLEFNTKKFIAGLEKRDTEVKAYLAGEADRQAKEDQAKKAAAIAAANKKPAQNYGGSSGTPIQGTPNDKKFLECTIDHESRNVGMYTAESSNGLWFGAYQFLQSTWDSVARSAGRNELVGVRPSQASPADQDALAIALLHQQGTQPWNGRCAQYAP